MMIPSAAEVLVKNEYPLCCNDGRLRPEQTMQWHNKMQSLISTPGWAWVKQMVWSPTVRGTRAPNNVHQLPYLEAV